MKNIRRFILVPLLTTLIFMISILIYRLNLKNPLNTSNNNLITSLPRGWNLKVEDSTNCHTIFIRYNGKYVGELKDYIKEYIFGGKARGEILDLNSFGINSSNVIDMGQQGVGNLNTIYVKSVSGDVYVVEINYTADQRNPATFCNDIKPVVTELINTLN